WAIALGGLYLWRGINAESVEPYFQLLSGAIIISIASWMIWRTWADQRRAILGAAHHHHDHSDVRRIDTGHGILALEVFEDGVPPRWRVRTESGRPWQASDVSISTERPGGGVQSFTFVDRGDFLESTHEIPEPHEFIARVRLGHDGHSHDYDVSFVEDHAHGH